jgi:C-terminal processing protease CtpA/Prc
VRTVASSSDGKSYSVQAGGILVTETTVEESVPYFGVTFDDVTPAFARREGIPAWRGVRLRSVVRDGPADRAGLRADDVVTNFDGTDVASANHARDLVRSANPSLPVPVLVQRDGASLGMNVQLGTSKTTFRDVSRETLPHERDGDSLGMEISTIPAHHAKSFYGVEGTAALVSDVTPGGPAYRAGIRSPDRILSVGGRDVHDAESALDALTSEPVREPRSVRVHDGEREHIFDLKPDPGFNRETKFYFPFVVGYESGPTHGEFEMVEGLLFDYEKTWRRSETREPDVKTEWGFLLDLFHVRKSPSGTRVRILWLISFRSGRP